MRPTGRPAELFAAFSRIVATAFQDERLLSCPNLSKAPNYGAVLRRFLLGLPARPAGLRARVRLALRYLLTNGLHFGFMLLGALFLRLLGWRRPSCLTAKPLLVIDSFAVLPKLAEDGVFQELYMPGLAEEALAAGHAVLRLHRLYGSRNPLVLWRAFRVLAAEGGGLTELHLLRCADWLLLARHALVYPLSLRRLLRALARHPEGSPESAIREALLATSGQCVLIGEARRLAARRLGALLAERESSAHIVSWYENQTVNTCFQRGLAQAEAKSGRHIPVTGAQLFIWPDTLLNNHPEDEAPRLGLTPDRVLVNGAHFLPETTRQDYAVGPSLRYGALFAGEEILARTDGPLLVLLSYHPEEIRRVLRLTLPLARHDLPLVYKFHPATRREDYAALLPERPRFAEASLQDALRNSAAVLGSGSGALAEAAAQGIFVLQVEEDSADAGLRYLPDYGKGALWVSVRCPEEVEEALDGMRGRDTQSREYRESVATFRSLLFTEPTKERIRKDFKLQKNSL